MAKDKAGEASEQGGSAWQKVKDSASQAYDSVSCTTYDMRCLWTFICMSIPLCWQKRLHGV